MPPTRPRNMYTEEKLRPAVAASATLGEVLAHLGLPDNPKRRRYASERIKALGIDGSHLRSGVLLYPDARLAEAVAASKSMVEVATMLGAIPVGGTIHHLKRRVTALGVDTSHFERRRPAPPLLPRPTSAGFRRVGRKLAVDEQLLREAVPQATSIAGVIRRLGLEPSGPRHRIVREEILRLGLDTEHMLGQGFFRGNRGDRRLPIDQVLDFRPEQVGRRRSKTVKRALLECGVPDQCAMCGTGPEWRGRPMGLEIDHISGDYRDNRRENLRLLCPNCHATTDTYCRGKRADRPTGAGGGIRTHTSIPGYRHLKPT